MTKGLTHPTAHLELACQMLRRALADHPVRVLASYGLLYVEDLEGKVLASSSVNPDDPRDDVYGRVLRAYEARALKQPGLQ